MIPPASDKNLDWFARLVVKEQEESLIESCKRFPEGRCCNICSVNSCDNRKKGSKIISDVM